MKKVTIFRLSMLDIKCKIINGVFGWESLTFVFFGTGND